MEKRKEKQSTSIKALKFHKKNQTNLVSREDRGVSGKREMDSGEGNQVGLELVQVDVEGSVESEGGGDGGYDLGDEPVEVGVAGRLDTKVSSADFVDTNNHSQKALVLTALIETRQTNKTYASLSTMKEQSECSKVV